MKKERESPGSEARAASTTPIAETDSTGDSRQVSWAETHWFLEAVLAQANVGPLPWAGTPEWVAMADGDPRKLLALAAAGEHHVLRIETAQAAMAAASREISGAADWTAISREIRGRNDFYTSRPWLRRAVS